MRRRRSLFQGAPAFMKTFMIAPTFALTPALALTCMCVCLLVVTSTPLFTQATQRAPAPTNPRVARHSAVLPTASMSIERMAHTATTLRDGRVLVAGGFVSERSAAHSAQSYNPVTERFASLPRMITVRHSHSATLLPSGKVLLVGGFVEGNTTTTSAELFDPASNTFTATGALRSPRAGHIAVLLGNGLVLIAGGVGPDWRFLSTAELYDPATGRFLSTGSMTVARESHTAVLLHDGRVLIAGGHRGRRADIILYTSAEVYEPNKGAFRRVGDMSTRRHKHDAVLLQDGRVLVTGGSDERDNEGAYTSTELFDPRADAFTNGPAMRLARYKHVGSSVQLSSGMIVVAGGAAYAEAFDPRTSTFTKVDGDGSLAGQFSSVAMVSGERVLITGGYGNGGGPRSMAWLYRP
jgi:hypothetical protein